MRENRAPILFSLATRPVPRRALRLHTPHTDYKYCQKRLRPSHATPVGVASDPLSSLSSLSYALPSALRRSPSPHTHTVSKATHTHVRTHTSHKVLARIITSHRFVRVRHLVPTASLHCVCPQTHSALSHSHRTRLTQLITSPSSIHRLLKEAAAAPSSPVASSSPCSLGTAGRCCRSSG